MSDEDSREAVADTKPAVSRSPCVLKNVPTLWAFSVSPATGPDDADLPPKHENNMGVRMRNAQLGGKKRAPQKRPSSVSSTTMLQNAKAIILQLDPGGTVTFLNTFAEAFFGFPRREILHRHVAGTIVPEENADGPSLLNVLHSLQSDPERYAKVESENLCHNGERRWILWANTPLRNSQGELTGLLCVGQDVTDRKWEEEFLRNCCGELQEKVNRETAELVRAYEKLQQETSERKWAEDVLRASEEKYRLVVENASEAIVIIQDNYIQYFNPKTLRVLNHPADTLTTRTVDEVIHPDDRDMSRNRRLRMIKGESVPSNFCCRIIDKDGGMRWLEINSVLITWMGRPAILSFFNNITERKRAEAEVQAYQEQLRSLASELSLAEERERRRLATNLHDHIGQTLALTKIKLGALEAQLPPGHLSDESSFIRSLIDRTIQYTKSLTFELSPPILYELGFEATIEWLGEQVQKDHQIHFELRSDGKQKALGRDISVLMFQAVRELVMNIIKHAHAQKIRIAIYQADNTLHVDVEDDGVGFVPSRAGRNSFGFFSIRERLNHFSGTFHIDSEPGRGTRVSLTAPLSTKRRSARG